MLAERTGDRAATPARGGLLLHVSKLLLASMVAAIATSVAMVVAGIMIAQGPRPGPGPDQGPPPLPLGPIVMIILITGMFVVSWITVVAVIARDQILRRIQEQGPAEMVEIIGRLQATLAEDRRSELAALEQRLVALTAEYGEQRETDGYVNGMRAAARPTSGGGEVRPLYRLPPA